MGRAQGDGDIGTRVWGLGTWGRETSGTWGHQLWDVGTCGTATRGRQIQGRRGRGMWIIIAKVGGECDISFFVKMCYLWFHLPKPHWTPYDVYTKYLFIIGVSALTIVIRVRIGFCCRAIFPCLRKLYVRKYNRGNVWKVARKRKSRISLNFTFNLNNLHLASILFTWLKFTCVNMHSQKRVSGNQPLSIVSKHLLLGLPLKICRTQ